MGCCKDREKEISAILVHVDINNTFYVLMTSVKEENIVNIWVWMKINLNHIHCTLRSRYNKTSISIE